MSLIDFNPENIERWEELSDYGEPVGKVVAASDYDQLLKLYKERYLENIRLLNDASVWRNRAISAEEELKGSNRIGPRPRNHKGTWR